MDMKRFVLILVGIMLISFGIAGITLRNYLHPGYWQQQRVEKNYEKPLDVQDIKKIVVICDSANVEITTTDEPQGKATYYAASLSNNITLPFLEVKASEGVLTVEVIAQRSFTIGIGTLSQRLELLIPTQYAEALDVEVKYGNVQLGDLRVNDCSLRGESGNFDISGLSAKNANITVRHGNVKLNDFCGDLTLENSSGETVIDYAEYASNRLEIQTKHGDIKLKLPATAQFSLDANIEHGEIKCAFPITVQGANSHNRLQGRVGEGTGNIKVSASSGNIEITN